MRGGEYLEGGGLWREGGGWGILKGGRGWGIRRLTGKFSRAYSYLIMSIMDALMGMHVKKNYFVDDGGGR